MWVRLYGQTCLTSPVFFFSLTVPSLCFHCGTFLFVFRVFLFVCHAVLSVPYSHVDTSLEKADLLVLVYVMFVFVTFTYCVLGQVWYLKV